MGTHELAIHVQKVSAPRRLVRLPARATIAVAALLLALCSLLILPVVAFRGIQAANDETHNFDAVRSSVVGATSRMMLTVVLAEREFEPAPTDAGLKRIREAERRVDVLLDQLQGQLPEAAQLGLGDETEQFLRSSRQVAAAYDEREQFFLTGFEGAAPPNQQRYLQLRAAQLAAMAGFSARSADVSADLSDERTSAMERARLLLIVAIGVGGLFGAVAVAEAKRSWRDIGRERALRLNAEKRAEHSGQLVNLASHELRNPLSIMTLAAQVLEEAGTASGDAFLVSASRDAYTAARRTEAVVAELLDMGRLDASRLDLDLRPVDLRPVIAEAVSLTAAYRGERLVQIRGDGHVIADSGRLAIIVRNLIDNAFKHSPPDGTLHVEITQRQADLDLEVRDEGPGIARENRERVFERFQQPRSSGSGLGIGLYLSRELARRMGGELVVEDAAVGACLRLTLPPAESEAAG